MNIKDLIQPLVCEVMLLSVEMILALLSTAIILQFHCFANYIQHEVF